MPMCACTQTHMHKLSQFLKTKKKKKLISHKNDPKQVSGSNPLKHYYKDNEQQNNNIPTGNESMTK